MTTEERSGTPRTDALLTHHKAETTALDERFPEHGNIATRHEWREHALRQAKELLEHTHQLECENADLRAQLAEAKVEIEWLRAFKMRWAKKATMKEKP